VNASGEGEVDAETIRDSLVVVESRAAALAGPSSAGAFELRRAIESGVIAADHVHAEIGARRPVWRTSSSNMAGAPTPTAGACQTASRSSNSQLHT
jgi:hypothetical protein